MKRLWIPVAAIAAIVAIVLGVRMAERRGSAEVAALLPRTTVAFAHLPDFNATINEWHRSDIYQIYQEPAVQEFLKKPLGQAPKPGSISGKIQEFQELEAKDAFIALTSAANDKPKVVAGFEFHCSQSVADRIIGGWRTKMNPSAKQEHVAYQKHDIEVFSQSTFSLAMVQDGSWWFFGNDLDELKAVLDRADGRMKDRDALLTADEAYRDAIGAMPNGYALLVYFQPKTLVERLAALRQSMGSAGPNDPSLSQIRSICLATRFDRGKLHDVTFLGIPQQKTGELARTSLGLASNTAIFYAASVIDFSKQIGILFPSGSPNPLGPAAQKISGALAAAGITAADWEAAFGAELNLVSDWPEQSRWPSLLISAPVKDQTRARKIVDTLIRGLSDSGQWQQGDAEGAHFWQSSGSSGWLSFKPVMALSDRIWATGLDRASVESAVRRSQKPEPGLSDSENYRHAVQLVPKPTHVFAYADPALIYTRIDAAVRPILLMGAAFLPAANDYADLTKVPPPEVITRHLSPIVYSQYYSGKGYVGESVGPLTLNQATMGVAVLGGMGAMAYQRFMPGGLPGFGAPRSQRSGGNRRNPPPGVGSPLPIPASPTASPRATP